MEELHLIKLQVALPCRSHNTEKGRNKSSAEAQAAQRLIQRILSAARLAAAQNSRTSREKQTSHFNQSQDATQNELKRKEHGVRDDCPEIYLESDIDGLCYLGPRRKSLKDGNNNNNNTDPGIR